MMGLAKINITLPPLGNVSALVEYDYQPEEPAKPYGDDPYPGADEGIDITSIFVQSERASGEMLGMVPQEVIDSVREPALDHARAKHSASVR